MTRIDDMKAPLEFSGKLNYKLVGFCMIMLVACLADAIMAYTSPVYIESKIGNPFWMGLILASSSVVGIVADFMIGGWLRGRRSRFFAIWALAMAVLFPLVFLLLPAVIPTFLVAMAVWGIYYELVQFSNYHFIEEHSQRKQHAFAWGWLATFRAAAYTLGPWIAGLAIAQSIEMPFYVSLLLSVVALVAVVFYLLVINNTKHKVPSKDFPHRTLQSEFRVWSVLFKKMWHIFLFLFALSLVDATFWTVGVLLSQEIGHGEQGLLLVVYGLPGLILGLFSGVLAQKLGKKITALLAGICGGLLLASIALLQNDIAILLTVFVASCFLSICWPTIYAAFEDYVTRLGHTGDEFIGLQRSVTSLSYILGPIIAGGVASLIGNQTTFGIMGIFLALVSAFVLMVVPRKVHMPQGELHNLESTETLEK